MLMGHSQGQGPSVAIRSFKAQEPNAFGLCPVSALPLPRDLTSQVPRLFLVCGGGRRQLWWCTVHRLPRPPSVSVGAHSVFGSCSPVSAATPSPEI